MPRKSLPLFLSSLFILVNQGQAANKVFISEGQGLSGNDINTILYLGQNYYFKSNIQVTLPTGVQKHRYIQYFQGVPVWDVSVAASQFRNQDNLSNISGSYLTEVEKDLNTVMPKISKEKALKLARVHKKIVNSTLSLVSNEEVNLYIFQDKSNKARLVYKISFVINGQKPTRPYFIMDANSGDILEQWDGLTSKNAIGPGGNLKTGQYNYGKDYGFLDVSNTCLMTSINVDTFDMKNMTSGGVLFQFNCAGNPPINTYKYTNGAYSPINDAHYFGNVVFNMYSQWFNKKPLTMKLKLRVHYGTNYENAFWDGQQMTFGDGYTRFYPLVSLDVVSHEVSHGFTEQNSHLVYSKQPGGINEAFSDMAGEAAEYFNNVNKPVRNDWLVGGSIMKNGIALRYFDDPTKDGRSIGHAKDYYDGLDVHYSSGVFNKAFYTLATKANWNTEKAFRAFVLANQIYWNQNSDFTNAACGVKKAANDLTYRTQDVVDAFKVVGVDASCGDTPTEEELKNNIPVNNISSSIQDEEKNWYIDVPAGVSLLTVKTYNGKGDPDLYVRFGAKPTVGQFDCRPYTPGPVETCKFSPPKAGRYYVMIKTYRPYTGLSLSAAY